MTHRFSSRRVKCNERNVKKHFTPTFTTWRWCCTDRHYAIAFCLRHFKLSLCGSCIPLYYLGETHRQNAAMFVVDWRLVKESKKTKIKLSLEGSCSQFLPCLFPTSAFGRSGWMEGSLLHCNVLRSSLVSSLVPFRAGASLMKKYRIKINDNVSIHTLKINFIRNSLRYAWFHKRRECWAWQHLTSSREAY